MRVLQVLPSVVAGGGAEQSLVMVAPFLRQEGLTLHLAVLTDRQTLVPSVERAGVVVHDLSAHRSTIGRALAIRDVIGSVGPAVVHSTLFEADISTRLASIGLDVPILSTWANTTYSATRRDLEPGVAPWKRDVVRRVDAATAKLSRSRFHAVTAGVAADGIAALGVDPGLVTVVERGRDPQSFVARTPEGRARARAALVLAEDDEAIVTVARQAHQKGHVHLLAAFDRVAAARPHARLVLIGPRGAASPLVDEAISTMRHGDRVVDLGERSDVGALLAGFDVFVLASLAEGAAGALIEAMAVGAPIVVTEIEGLAGVVDPDRTAIVVRPGDPEDLATGLLRALDDPHAGELRASAARAEFERRFSIEHSARQLAALYRSVAG